LLDRLEYSADPFYRCPSSAVRDRKAHCFDGAVLAAAALRRLGHRPLLVDLRAVRDDDHVIAVFRRDGLWGAVAKSNFVGLRFREPLFRGLRELALSYVEDYYNLEGLKSLRSFSSPVDLRRFDALDGLHDDAAMEAIATALDRAAHHELLSRSAVRALRPVDDRSFRAGMVGAIEAGMYVPSGRSRVVALASRIQTRP
jgi:hypothetical protein